MDVQHWQAQFENWLKNHHQHQDAAHDVCHFRRVWATAQKLAADDDVDMLVILTACYFHDIVSLARVFAVSGALGVALFDGEDPFAQHRPLDDKRYALDHFQTKLLKLPQTMQTARGKQLAQHNAQFLVEFMAKLSAELAGENEGVDHKVIDAFSPAG